MFTELVKHVDELVRVTHELAFNAGWWDGADAHEHRILIASKLALVHSEVSEALEGLRKDLRDEHLPQYESLVVELADAVIRICDIAGYLKLPLGEALAAKLEYNTKRDDHKRESRQAQGGKKI